MAAPALSPADLYKVNAKLCYPFVEAIMSTLKVQCGVDGRLGKPAFKDRQSGDRADVLISTNITSPDLIVSISMCFPQSVFFKVMGKMLGEIFSEVTPDLEDAAKELMNIVFNQAKKPLTEKGMKAVRSIPLIVFGSKINQCYLTRGQTIALPVDTDYGPFSLEITTQEISVSDSV